ncbi:MAG: hypothetical protein JWM87_116 [Candidatus Eremiobacteraeota bacterium]|nr:hypothetical protein [Candidatus Eremiobacteraeota bacterium]
MKRAPRIVRLVWLAALLVLGEPATFVHYRRRFRVPMYTFWHDVRLVRRAALYIYAFLYGRFGLLLYLDSNPNYPYTPASRFKKPLPSASACSKHSAEA